MILRSRVSAWLAISVAVGMASLPLDASLADPAPGAPAPGVIERPVSFTVTNSNSSGIPCPGDESTYEVRGVLVGPTSAFESGRPQTVSVYLHGFSFGGKFLWSFKPVPGYDLPVEFAQRGHVSLSIDRLGYDSSGHPHGHLNCIGSSADVTHQIVQALRRGSYEVEGGAPIPVEAVVLVGHDTGGAVAEVEAYSYDDIDGLVVWGWADQGFSQWVLDRYPERSAFCARGGEEAESGDPGGGYFHWPSSEEEVRQDVGQRMEPRVLETSVSMRNRNPCGDLLSAASMSNYHENGGRLGEIDVPVLLIYSDDDIIFTREGGEQQKAHFTGTDDLTWVMLEDAGHFPMLERRAEDHRQVLLDWLNDHSFGRRE
ncbi:MAG: alpha/beta fold hydrolase [Actinomycetota bacterium]